MAKLKLIDPSKAALFSFAPTCETTQAAQAELLARGWSNVEAMKHIDAAIDGGAYTKEVTKQVYPTRSEKGIRAGASEG